MLWLVQKTSTTLSTNQMQNRNQSRLRDHSSRQYFFLNFFPQAKRRFDSYLRSTSAHKVHFITERFQQCYRLIKVSLEITGEKKKATGTETCKLDFKQSAVYSKWFEPGGNMWSFSLIVLVRVVLRRTVDGISGWRYWAEVVIRMNDFR